MIKINKYVIAALLATLASLNFSISMLLVKQLSKDIHIIMVILTRNIIGTTILTPLFINLKIYKTRPKQIHLYFLRIILTVFVMLCTYYTYRHLPISLATTIGMSGALSTTVLSFFILREKISKMQWLMVIIGYLGVLFVIKPHSFVFEFATLTSIMANIIAALVVIITKIMSKKDSPITIICYSTFGTFILSFLIGVVTGELKLIESRDLLLLSGSAMLGTLTQFCLINALKYSSPVFTAPFEYSRLIFGFLLGMLIFDEMPDIYMIIGGIIIIASNYFITYTKMKQK